jgi:hypothetical protein
MKTRGLDLTLPKHSISVETVPGGSEPVQGFLPGDFLLGRAHGVKHDLIRFGQNLRLHGEDKRYCVYTHAALVVSPSGKIIEAVGEGVRATSLKQYVIDKEVYQVVRIEASAHDRQQVIDFAAFVLDSRAPYAFLANISTALWAFTGSRLMFFLDGSFTCSGLVAASLERTGAMFGMNSARMMPAQLAVFFGAPTPPAAPPKPRRALSAWLQRRPRGQ